MKKGDRINGIRSWVELQNYWELRGSKGVISYNHRRQWSEWTTGNCHFKGHVVTIHQEASGRAGVGWHGQIAMADWNIKSFKDRKSRNFKTTGLERFKRLRITTGLQ